MITAAEFERESQDLDRRIAAALAKLSLAGRHELRQSALAKGLSAVQSLVLERLARRGPCSVGELADLCRLSAPTVSDSVAALVRRRLVRKKPVASDARRVLVEATARGARLGREQSLWPDVFAGAVGAMSHSEKVVLLGLLLRLVAELVAAGVVREARMCPTCVHFRPGVHPGSERPHHCALVDLPLSAEHLRADCGDHAPAAPEEVRRRLVVLAGGPS
jgi:DNA-binding MarR family transcriptional regulator